MKRCCPPLAALVALAVLVGLTPVASAQEGTPGAPAREAPTIYASPIHAGCYIIAPGQCRIHADPFTINIVSGTKLVMFRLVVTPSGRTVYDFATDISNPPPSSGTTYTPSLVTQDFAATCGSTYALSLQGKDSGDPNPYNLGLTGSFTCPSTVP